jgi:hypothetical protein
MGVWEAFFPPARTLFVVGMTPGYAMHHCLPTRRGCSDGAIRRPGGRPLPGWREELPGLEDEVHGGPDADVGTSIASGLEGGLSSA